MTDGERKRLRELAEVNARGRQSIKEEEDFRTAASPSTVLTLLDEVEAAKQAALMAIRLNDENKALSAIALAAANAEIERLREQAQHGPHDAYLDLREQLAAANAEIDVLQFALGQSAARVDELESFERDARGEIESLRSALGGS